LLLHLRLIPSSLFGHRDPASPGRRLKCGMVLKVGQWEFRDGVWERIASAAIAWNYCRVARFRMSRRERPAARRRPVEASTDRPAALTQIAWVRRWSGSHHRRDCRLAGRKTHEEQHGNDHEYCARHRRCGGCQGHFEHVASVWLGATPVLRDPLASSAKARAWSHWPTHWPWALGYLPHDLKALRLQSENYGDGQLRALLRRDPVHSPIRAIVLRIADKRRTNGSLNHIFRIIPHRALHGGDSSSAQFIVHRYYRSAAHKFRLTVHRLTCSSVCFGPAKLR